MLIPATFTCPHCWQVNETSVDPSGGAVQTYVEDCPVCCRPLVLRVRVAGGKASVEAEPESG
jgi:hypothetical protein